MVKNRIISRNWSAYMAGRGTSELECQGATGMEEKENSHSLIVCTPRVSQLRVPVHE